eukprot:symbB.v1.2.008291.t1/scaffold519.1/size192877/19
MRRASDENSSSSSSSSLSSDSSRPEHRNPPGRRHRPRDSQDRREPDSFDDEIASRPAGAVSVELKIQKDFTTQCHAAYQKRKQFEPKVHEAHSGYRRQQRAWELQQRLFNEHNNHLQEMQQKLEAAKNDPVATLPPEQPIARLPSPNGTFQNGQMVKIKATYWKELRLPIRFQSPSAFWRVCHFSGSSYTLMLPHSGTPLEKVPPDALEALEQITPGMAVVVTDEALELPEQLATSWRRCMDNGIKSGIFRQRSSDIMSTVSFHDGTVLDIPNANLRPENALPQPPAIVRTPAQPKATPEPQDLYGFHYLAYVRDQEGVRGIVKGLSSENLCNLKVVQPSLGKTVSVPPSLLRTEKDWFEQKVTEYTEKALPLKEEVEKKKKEMEVESAKLKVVQEEQAELEKQYRQKYWELSNAKQNAARGKVVKAVKFKGHDRPQDWRDVSNYVSLDWSVLMESKTVRVLVKVQQLQKWATEMEGVEHFVSAQMTSGNQQRGQSDFFCLSSDVATTILEKCGAPAPDPVHYITLLKCACGGSNQVVLDKEIQDFFNGPAGIVTPQEVPPPPQVAKFLRNYQLKGYQWLVNNARNHLGSLLADDMGLGKTLQTISLMLYLKKNDLLKKPMLVVVPKGLLPTWQRELEYWAAGDLTVHVFYGDHRRLPATAETLEAAASAPPPKRRRVRAKQHDAHDAAAEATAPSNAVRIDVVLTAYGTVRSDAEKLSAPKMFAGLVLDEAQQIKNPKTQLSNSLNQIAKEVGPLRVALTGTPVENGLTDLYSIIEFILPGYLSSSKENFQKDFAGRLKLAARKGKTSEDQKALDLLNRLKAPFVLRRSKTDNEIEADLPEKLEKTYVCELGKEQRTLYQKVQESLWMGCASEQDSNERSRKVMDMMHALREVCNHPACLKKERRPPGFQSSKHYPPISTVDASGKCAMFHSLLNHIMKIKEKTLVFCQSHSAIDALVHQIEQRKDMRKFGQKALRITGQTEPKHREANIEAFQTDPKCPILVMSQVGGVGLTLTAATHVIHFDRQYNPAKENQATDRAHRIGQTQKVSVYYLVSQDTFEVRLAEILEQKRQLSDMTMQSCQNFFSQMNNEELQEFFSLKS